MAAQRNRSYLSALVRLPSPLFVVGDRSSADPLLGSELESSCGQHLQRLGTGQELSGRGVHIVSIEVEDAALYTLNLEAAIVTADRIDREELCAQSAVVW